MLILVSEKRAGVGASQLRSWVRICDPAGAKNGPQMQKLQLEDCRCGVLSTEAKFSVY